eukprot:CAMPEP_0171127430 /NCGR_PEP_ID=MMETSP0766_2-20121228/115230_1 /TAXON_ID=439317 /ORGANISM="Gambierdiscus australes, Strain CAWD 149" /LENGTH=37 /DNA_ID= /DNA_START= /DNA_END= /DNA_ORIENTATION=
MAATSPRCKEVDEDRLPVAPLVEADLLSVQEFEGEVR